MRASDLPGERARGPADEPAGWPAGRLAELRQRLERLPPGHPSAPDWAGPDPADQVSDPADQVSGLAGEASAPAELAPDSAELAAGADGTGHPRDDPGELLPDRREQAALGGPGAPAPGRPRAAGGFVGEWRLPDRELGHAGPRPAYRPWFTDADWAQPWFTGDIW